MSVYLTRILGFSINPKRYEYTPGEWVVYSGSIEVHFLGWAPLRYVDVYVTSDDIVLATAISDGNGKFKMSTRVPIFPGIYICQAHYDGSWSHKSCSSEAISIRVKEGEPPPDNGWEPPPDEELPPSPQWQPILLYGSLGVAAAVILLAIVGKGAKK